MSPVASFSKRAAGIIIGADREPCRPGVRAQQGDRHQIRGPTEGALARQTAPGEKLVRIEPVARRHAGDRNPGRKFSDTIRSFSSQIQLQRRRTPVFISIRSIIVSVIRPVI